MTSSSSHTNVKNWFASFKTDKFYIEVRDRLGNPGSVSTEVVYDMILSLPQIELKQISLNVSHEHIHRILHVNLDVRKASPEWILKWTEASRLIFCAV